MTMFKADIPRHLKDVTRDEIMAAIAQHGGDSEVEFSPSGTKAMIKEDPNLTGIASDLFFNVFKGELSIVGPSPITTDELLKLDPHTRAKILSIKPGITGLWQTSGRSNMEWNERIALEVHYIDNHSLLLDLYLLLKTVPSILFCRGAY